VCNYSSCIVLKLFLWGSFDASRCYFKFCQSFVINKFVECIVHSCEENFLCALDRAFVFLFSFSGWFHAIIVAKIFADNFQLQCCKLVTNIFIFRGLQTKNYFNKFFI